MRKLLAAIAILAACTQAPPPAVAPPPPPPPPAPHGFTIEEEARVLMLEDRREFDAAMASEWLANPNSLHRARMALALARIGPYTFADTNNNGERDADERQAGVDQLVALVHDPDRTVRETAAFALGEIGDPSSVSALFDFAHDRQDAGVAAEAIEALSKLSASVPFARYTELTGSSEREGARARAVQFLFRYNSDEASELAATLLGDRSELIRQMAAYALARRAYAPARARLELIASDPSVLTRAYVVSALGRIGAKESLPMLLDAIRDAHPWVRTNAVVAIARLATKDVSALDRPDMPQEALRVIALTDDPDPGTRASSLDALGWYATRSDIAHKRLFEIATTGSRWDRELATGAIARHFPNDLGPILDNASPWAKVRVLENTKDSEEGVALRHRFAADPDPMVRGNAIGNIPDKHVDAEIDIIRPALDESDVIVRANAMDRYALSKSVDVAILTAAEQRGRHDSQNDARLSAITALAEIDRPERESFFRDLLRDNDPVVRRTAADLIADKMKKKHPQYTPLPVERPAAEYAEIVTWSRQQHTATIHMTRGAIELVLLTRDAPITTWNFAQLARKHYFDNTSFMRVVPNFVIQGGDPRNDMNGGPGYAIRDEINIQKYTRGAVGMALSGPDTGGSQFFITHSPQPHLDGGYTIFGRVYDGMNAVVDQTERGDRVETITIDEHTPSSHADLSGGAKTPLPTEIGPTTAARLMAVVPEYPERKTSYAPDLTELESIAQAIQPGDHIEVYMGTWCSDSQREVPRFLKIVDVLKEKYSKELPISFVAVDRSKQKPEDLLAGKSIEKVATFIYYRGDRELGRIVEKPTGLLEDDLLAVSSKQ
jgi:cyclophilin family peptidyl-prolyl cis-trans isomerase/HEAT repeat protein/thiol-disulfide isomerase/thioredoxin